MRAITYKQAGLEAMDEEMARDPKVFILGESVHDEGIEAQIRLMQSEKKISSIMGI